MNWHGSTVSPKERTVVRVGVWYVLGRVMTKRQPVATALTLVPVPLFFLIEQIAIA